MSSYPTIRAMNLVEAERERQNSKWGEQNHSPAIWYAILGEEFGEVGKEICEADAYAQRVYAECMDDPDANRLVERLEANPHLKRLQTELVHTAAVAIAMLESLERNEKVTL